MKKLVSLPANLVKHFYELEKLNRNEWFCTSDPVDCRVGSGGGTAWLLEQCRREEASDVSFKEWLAGEKRILVHAGGQSRRLPAYAPTGKILTPVPVFRWERGQQLNQNLLSLQLPLYERIMEMAPASLRTLIASGDVYIRSEESLQEVPEADVVCYGLWTDLSLATHHGVFVAKRDTPEKLDFMLQKPSISTLESLSSSHLFLMDIGIWLLSDKAVDLLMKRSFHTNESAKASNDNANDITPGYYDLYSNFGTALGQHPTGSDEAINALTVAIVPLQGGEFYHYGTSRELISSTLAVQNKVFDQRKVIQRKVKPHPAMFVQNADVRVKLQATNDTLWIENSVIGARWQLEREHILTGVPENDWELNLKAGICIDVVPVKVDSSMKSVARPYGMDDSFRGSRTTAVWMGRPVREWMSERKLEDKDLPDFTDLQQARLFPVVNTVEELGWVVRWMTTEPDLQAGRECWLRSAKLSADELLARAELPSLYSQRDALRKANLPVLAANYERSVFYQSDLLSLSDEWIKAGIEVPDVVPDSATLLHKMHNRMFRARCFTGEQAMEERSQAFRLMREALLAEVKSVSKVPRLNVLTDQIVWSRSPVRIDLAGGWTDTPPYSLYAGGSVVNVAIELNSQQPLQVYLKPSPGSVIVLRSIDMGAMEIIETYEELRQYTRVGSPFSIPKAALGLAGFGPESGYSSLQQQLEAFGAGIELTLLAAIPAGSGLGTSSLLASTVLGGLNDFCGLGWDKNDICLNTLALEQLLTTGGGWQDQYGGVLQGVKLLSTEAGLRQAPSVSWLPEYLFTQPEFSACHLLYYTGITRTAKHILAEIVEGMFLNSSAHLSLLSQMKDHASAMATAIQRGDFTTYGQLIATTWTQNKALDSGTNPPAVEAIIHLIKEYTLGYKLPGAGGGGYLYMVARDPEAAARIKKVLTDNPPNARARFVTMRLSDKGLQISRS